MSIFPDQPFDEREERYFLAEILKDSPIQPGNLLRVIQAEGIRPRWTEIALPYGRSVSACQKAYDNLYYRVFPGLVHPLGPAPLPSPSAKSKKRPAAGTETPGAPNRELQPRTPGFATVNEPLEATAYPIGLAETSDQRKKKRGRPSKAEVEVKAAEYAARGEPYPPPRRSKNPKPPLETMGTTAPPFTFTPVTMGPGGMEGASSGKKRTSKVKVQRDGSSPGLATTVTPAPYGQREADETLGMSRQPTQPFRREAPEDSLAATRQIQDSTAEGPVIGETLSYQPMPQNISTDAFATRQTVSAAEHDQGTERQEPPVSSTIEQRTTAEHGPSEAMHGTSSR
ncbi:MAG: hypothetical protein Q9220_004525 [cf. Caloplaca sp. 1 TL-2023]